MAGPTNDAAHSAPAPRAPKSIGRRDPTPASLRNFVSHIWAADRLRATLALVLSILATLTESVGLLLLIPLVTQVGLIDGDGSSTQWITAALERVGIPITLGWILTTYVALVAIRSIIEAARSIALADLRHRLVDSLRHDLFGAVACAGWAYHLRHRTSDIAHVLSTDIGRVRVGTTAVFEIAARSVAALGYLAVAVRLAPGVTALAVALVAILLLVLSPTLRAARSSGRQQTVRSQNQFAGQQEFLDALKVVKSHGDEARHVAAYRRGLHALRATIIHYDRTAAVSGSVLQVGIASAVAIVTWVSVRSLDTSGARLLVVIVVIARLAPIASTLLEQGQMIANTLPAYANTIGWTRDAERHDESAGTTGTAQARPNESVELVDVSFSYGAELPNAVNDVSVRIEAGQTVALVGKSGAGKTTIGDMLLGLLPPDSGEILIDGRPLARSSLHSWRRHVAYVPQDTSLLHASIRANITMLNDDEWDPALDQRLHEVIELIALTSVVERLDNGLLTPVGDRGVRLSGGERQRIAIARALWRQPALLVLDEATSALDREHEQVVQGAIERLHGSVAMLVIAHRLTTVRHADEILVLDQGRVIERGTWEELHHPGTAFDQLAGA
ncbi:MAG: ABC transporter ATP-binding protein [Ilumatobacter sp.]